MCGPFCLPLFKSEQTSDEKITISRTNKKFFEDGLRAIRSSSHFYIYQSSGILFFSVKRLILDSFSYVCAMMSRMRFSADCCVIHISDGTFCLRTKTCSPIDLNTIGMYGRVVVPPFTNDKTARILLQCEAYENYDLDQELLISIERG